MKTFKKSFFTPFIGFVCAASLFIVPSAYAKNANSYASHSAEITRLAQAHQAGQVVIKSGDAVTIIAQRYAKANDIPFELAFKGLIAANPDAFEDAQNHLKIGAHFVIPNKDDLLKPETPPADKAAAVAVVAPPLPPTPVVSEPVAAIAPPSETQTPAVSTSASSDLMSLNIDELLKYRLEPWAWWLLGVLLAMLAVLFLRPRKDEYDDVPDSDMSHEHAPKVVLNPLGSVADTGKSLDISIPKVPTQTPLASPSIGVPMQSAPNVTYEAPALDALNTTQVDQDDLPYSDDEAMVSLNPSDRFNKALGGLSAASLDLAQADTPVVEQKPEQTITQTGSYNQFNFGRTAYNPDSFKSPSQQWRGIGFNISTKIVEMVQARVEVMNSLQVPHETLPKQTEPTLDVDVPTFLNNFSSSIPEPTYTSVDYEDLLDRTRLQAWLNVNTPEQILLFAQDAHDANYDDVAQLMLNDVLLRGNAEQCSAVLALRYLWSYNVSEF